MYTEYSQSQLTFLALVPCDKLIGLPIKDETLEKCVQNVYHLFSYIHDFLQIIATIASFFDKSLNKPISLYLIKRTMPPPEKYSWEIAFWKKAFVKVPNISMAVYRALKYFLKIFRSRSRNLCNCTSSLCVAYLYLFKC